MTEPPRPPGAGDPNDPTAPFNPYAHNDPTSGSTPPPPPPYGAPQPPPYGAPYGAPEPPPPYGPPPGQYGYMPQPGYAPTQDDRTWILVAHFGGAAGAFLSGGCSGWIVPLIALLARGNQSPAVRAESVKALNFQILWTIVSVVGYATACFGIGFVIIAIAWLIAVIFGIVAGVKASNNEPYNYPMTVQFIK